MALYAVQPQDVVTQLPGVRLSLTGYLTLITTRTVAPGTGPTSRAATCHASLADYFRPTIMRSPFQLLLPTSRSNAFRACATRLQARPFASRAPLTFAAMCLAAAAAAGCGDSATAVVGTPSVPATETFATSLTVNIAAMTRKSDNLYIQDLTVGGGAEVVAGRVLGMTYTGWLANATQFDSNVGGNNFNFTIGRGEVITGWDQGIIGMRVGGRRRIVIGSALGYGTRGSGPIPPNATLVFMVELKTLQ